MPMPMNVYYALNRALDATRQAEREASRLEREADNLRTNAQKEVQKAYDMLNRATVTLAEQDREKP